jgi:integrase/recombinase XerD
MVDEEVLVRNPFRQVKPPKSKRRPPRALSPDQVAALLAVVPDVRARLIVLLMVQQGLRCAGVASLRAEDVDLAGRWMRVREKNGHERTLWITDECAEALTLYLGRWPVASGPLVRAWRHNGGSMRCTAPGARRRWRRSGGCLRRR